MLSRSGRCGGQERRRGHRPARGARGSAEAKTLRQWSNGPPMSVGTVPSCKGPLAIVFKVFSGSDVESAGLPIELRWRRRPLAGLSRWSEMTVGARFTGVRGYLLIREDSAIQRGGSEYARTRHPMYLST
jgi:hypothetical protein